LDTNIVDALVNLVGRIGIAGSNTTDSFDRKVVDGAVDGTGAALRWFGRILRPIQTGRVQDYLLLASLVVLALVITLFLM
jgi:NADH-quinone oxidoreductase subunit L